MGDVHVMEVDPAQYKIVAVRALDNGIGKETVSSLVERHGALAGVNGGFYEVEGRLAGLAKGVLRIDDKWYATPYKNRGAILWDTSHAWVERLDAECSIEVDGQKIPIAGINRKKTEDDLVVYLPTFHRTTLTNPCVESVVQEGIVAKVRTTGSSPIPSDGFVISGLRLPIGTAIELSIPLPQMKYVVGGVPMLIQNGKRIKDHTPERAIASFFEPHRRTAVGVRKDGTWVFVATPRMTIDELTDIMENLECFDALNLDGGSSSAMVIEGQLVNWDEERKGSDAIIILANNRAVE